MIGLVVGVFILLVGFLFLILIVLTFAHIKARREIEDKKTLKDVSGKLEFILEIKKGIFS